MKFYGHAEWIVNFKKYDQIFDSHLRIKVMALWSFPICLYGEAIRLQCFLPTRYVSEHGHVYICMWRPLPDLLKIANIWTLVALYGSMMHCSLIPRHNFQLCSAAHWKACFSVCNTAKLGIGSEDKAMNLAVLMWWFSDNFFFFCLVCQSLVTH